MARWGNIHNLSRSSERVVRARWCQSFLCKAKGLMLRKSLGEDEGLLLVEGSEGRVNTSITMWLVFFPIAVAWLNTDFEIVELKLAKPWRNYLPSVPAQYTLEGPPRMLDQLSIGDRLEWVDA